MTTEIDIAIKDKEVEEILQSLKYIKRKDGAYYKAITCNNYTLYERIIKYDKDYLYSSSTVNPIDHSIKEAILITKVEILNKAKELNARNKNSSY